MSTRFIILFAGVLVAFSSCTTAYRSGQTPDDVYYSPGREADAYVQVERQDYRSGSNYRPSSRYEDDYYVHPNDRYLRMMVRNRYRWSAFDDYNMMSWNYNPYHSFNSYYAFGPSFGYSPMNTWGYSGFNSYWHWNNFYNPYYGGVVVVNPKNNPAAYQRLMTFNPGTYTNKGYYNPRPTLNNRYYTSPAPSRAENPRLGSSIRKAFSNGNNRTNDRYSPGSASERPTRTYTPSRSYDSPSPVRSSSSGGGGSTGGGGGVSRPTRGN